MALAQLWHGFTLSSVISFPILMMKYSDKVSLREKGFILVHSSRYSPLRSQGSRIFEATDHLTPTVRKQQWLCAYQCPIWIFYSSESSAQGTAQPTTKTDLLISINRIPHWQAQRPISQMILNFVKLVINMNYHRLYINLRFHTILAVQNVWV